MNYGITYLNDLNEILNSIIEKLPNEEFDTFTPFVKEVRRLTMDLQARNLTEVNSRKRSRQQYEQSVIARPISSISSSIQSFLEGQLVENDINDHDHSDDDN